MKNQKIINLRALAIFMVVLGHSIILYSSSWELYKTDVVCIPLDYLKQLINFIQMPLYFSISGYLYYFSQKKNKEFQVFIIDKMKRLLVPFIVFAFFWMLPIRLIVAYPGYKDLSMILIIVKKILYGTDNGHLWFLQALFTIFAIMYFLCKICKEKNIIVYSITLAILLIASLFGQKIGFIPVISNAFRYAFWFFLGFTINHYEKEIINRKVYIASWVTSILMLTIYIAGLQNKLIETLISLMLVLLLYNLIPCKESKIMKTIDNHSFGMYLFHSPLIYITYSYMANVNPFVVVFINFILFGTLSYILTRIIKNTKFKFIIGE